MWRCEINQYSRCTVIDFPILFFIEVINTRREITDKDREENLAWFKEVLDQKRQFVLMAQEEPKDDCLQVSISADCSETLVTIFIAQLLRTVELPVATKIMGGVFGLLLQDSVNRSEQRGFDRLINMTAIQG